jgi:competence protein ComEC
MPLLPILRKSPFARPVFFFAAGIAANTLAGNKTNMDAGTWIAALVAWALYGWISRKPGSYVTSWTGGIIISLAVFLCGFAIAQSERAREGRSCISVSREGIYKMVVTDLPEKTRTGTKVSAKICGRGSCRFSPGQNTIMIYFLHDPGADSLFPGDVLFVRTKLVNIPAPENPGDFDYRKYMAVRHVYQQAFIRKGNWKKDGGKKLSVRVISCRLRSKLVGIYKSLDIPPANSALLSALVLGYKSDVEAGTKKAFARAGVMHIMALSGFNVGILTVVLGFVMGMKCIRSKALNAIRTLVIIVFLWFFALVTGLSPSVTRAVAMTTLVLSGRLQKRRINTSNILFAAAFVILAANPGMLNDVSFRLSFMAVLGILVFQPVFDRLLPVKNRISRWLMQLFTLSCSAQLATFPLCIYYFHQFPVYFWLTNLYVVPLVSVIICLAVSFLAVSWFAPAALLFSKILAFLLQSLMLSITAVEKLPFSLIEGITISAFQAGILILIVWMIGAWINTGNKKMVFFILFMCLTFQLDDTVRMIRAKTNTAAVPVSSKFVPFPSSPPLAVHLYSQ